MKEITLVSGKGGTGKTSLAGSFSALASRPVISDCDVDAANLSLILDHRVLEEHPFKASRQAFIHPEKCTRCGLCRELCRFEAITEEFQVDSLECEGCGVCYHACRQSAVSFDEVISGEWFLSTTRYGPLVHARLGAGEENSGKLVTLLRQKSRELAGNGDQQLIINDGPPGIGCPVIASLAGANAALVVTEPTLSGIHDLERVLQVCRHFKVPPLVCINRSDLDEENSNRIKNFCREQSIFLAGEVPFDRACPDAVVQGIPVVEHRRDSAAARNIAEIWNQVSQYLL